MSSTRITQLEFLQTFLAISDTGSFSKAALLQDMPQSSISKRVLELELQLGVRLFERTGRGAKLSEAGSLLLPRARAIVDSAAGLKDALADELEKPKGLVTVAIQPSAGWPLIGHLHTQLKATHPGIQLRIIEALPDQIRTWLAEGNCDVGVLSAADPLSGWQKVLSVPMWLIGPPGDRLVRRSSICLLEALRLPLFLAGAPNGGRIQLEEEARRLGLRLQVAMEVNSIHQIKRLVAQGLGYSICSRLAVDSELEEQVLEGCKITSPMVSQSFFLAKTWRPRSRRATEAVMGTVQSWALHAQS